MNDDKDYYSFEYKDCDGTIYTHKVQTDVVFWPNMLQDFINFVENVYGYEIQQNIQIADFLEGRHDSWRGGYFKYEEDTSFEDFDYS